MWLLIIAVTTQTARLTHSEMTAFTTHSHVTHTRYTYTHTHTHNPPLFSLSAHLTTQSPRGPLDSSCTKHTQIAVLRSLQKLLRACTHRHAACTHIAAAIWLRRSFCTVYRRQCACSTQAARCARSCSLALLALQCFCTCTVLLESPAPFISQRQPSDQS